MKRKLIIIIGSLAVLASFVLVAQLVDNREKSGLIKETEERVCDLVIKDIYEAAKTDVINSVLTQLNNTGQVQINFPDGVLILVPKQ